MELPKINLSGGEPGGVLDGIKSKLGFSSGNQADDYDPYYDDDYDAYSDNYDDFSTYDDDQAAESQYSSYAPVTTRSVGTSRSRRSSYSSDSGSSFDSARTQSHPRLVSIDDVRANTQIPERLNRDPLPARHTTSGLSSRNTVGRASDYALSGSEIEAPVAEPAREEAPSSVEGGRRSAGYESLFGSTTPSTSSTSSSASGSSSSSVTSPSSLVGVHERTSGSFDPYAAYEGGSTTSHRPQRNLSVLKPVAYGEVESVAHSLKAGDAVVLSLRNTPNQLSKRILDFSFGVASALDASVDCAADKVFVIARSPLTDAERTKLRNQGVL